MAETKKLNLLSLHNLNIDLQFLESFAHKTPVAGLVEAFSATRQVCLCVFLVVSLWIF